MYTAISHWNQGHVTWPHLVSGFGKFDLNAHNFWHSVSNSIRKVVFGMFYRRVKKTQWWRHDHDVISYFWDFKISNLVKLNIGYHPSKFQIPWLSGSNFMEVSVRPQQTPLKRHYDVISYHCVSKLAYFVEHDIGYRPSKFQCSRMSGSNFMEGDGNPHPPVLQWDKKAQCL